MKKVFTIFLTTVLAVGLCYGFSGCDEPQGQDQKITTTYYGVVQTIENSEGLFVYIPEVGVCDLPLYGDEKQQDITIRDGDLIRMDFDAEDVEFMERYPVGIKTPVKNITVAMENVELVKSEDEYILTIDYTKEKKDEFLSYEKNLLDTVYFTVSAGMAGADNAPSSLKISEYCTATVENIGNQRLSLRLHLGEHPMQDFLKGFATRRIRLVAEFSSDTQPLVDFFDLQSTLTVADIEKIEIANCFGSALPTYLRPVEYKTSTTQEDIQTIYQWLKNLNNKTLVEITEQETYVDGGGEKILTVYTKLGDFKISESAERHLHIWDKYFAERNSWMPDIVGESVTYRFDYSTDETLNFYKWGAFSRTYDIKLSNIIFKSATLNYDEMLDVGFMLEQDVGMFKLFSSKLFYHESSGRYYEVVGETDFSIIFDTNETLSEKDLENIETLKELYNKDSIPYPPEAFVVNYYGEYASGAIVAMMTRNDMAYSQAKWMETVAGYAIQYNNGNRILVLYNGGFYNLTQAYENGYLTEDDIATVAMKHSVFCYYYYGLIDVQLACIETGILPASKHNKSINFNNERSNEYMY